MVPRVTFVLQIQNWDAHVMSGLQRVGSGDPTYLNLSVVEKKG